MIPDSRKIAEFLEHKYRIRKAKDIAKEELEISFEEDDVKAGATWLGVLQDLELKE